MKKLMVIHRPSLLFWFRYKLIIDLEMKIYNSYIVDDQDLFVI